MGNLTEEQNEKQDDVVLIGAKEIERKLHRSFIVLVNYKTGYGFPLKKTNGQPSVNVRELEEWVREWGNGRPFEKITNEVLDARRKKLKILAMQPKALNSLQEIVEYTGCMVHEVLNWFKLGVDCPIKRDTSKSFDGAGYSADAKELLLWMLKMGIRKGSAYSESHSLNSF